MNKPKKSNGNYLFGVIVAGLAIVGWGLGPGGWLRPSEVEAMEGVAVRRGDLRISEVARGNLEANNSIRLVNELEGRATIIYLAEEGAHLEAGDLVCELDVSDLRDRRVTQSIAVQNATAEHTKAREQYDIQVIQNKSDIAEANLEFKLAKLDLEKYKGENGEWTHEEAAANEAIKMAQEEHTQAQVTFEFTQGLFEKGFAQRTELERDQLSLERAKIKLEQARRERDLKLKYGHQRKLDELTFQVETRERDIEKVEKQALARLADFEAGRSAAEAKLKLERDKLAKLDDQIGKARILTPGAGMLVYSRKKSHRMGGEEVPEEGGEVHERQEIATIPRSGGMTAQASLHETRLKKVHVGQLCAVSVDALPGQVFEGEVSFLAAVADSGSWLTNPNQRLYRTEITLFSESQDMRPGMSCNIEILIDDLQDVLYVPRSAVFLDGGRTVCFVKNGRQSETRVVEVGQDNTKWVEIRSGLEQDEIVMLSPPASWEPAPASPQASPASHGAADGAETGRGARGVSAAGEGGRAKQPARQGEADPDAMRRGMERWRDMTPEQREQALEKLPPEVRERMQSMRRQREGGGGE